MKRVDDKQNDRSSLRRYFRWADRLREYYLEAMRSPEDLQASNEAVDEALMLQAHYHAALCVVLEGYEYLELESPERDALLQRYAVVGPVDDIEAAEVEQEALVESGGLPDWSPQELVRIKGTPITYYRLLEEARNSIYHYQPEVESYLPDRYWRLLSPTVTDPLGNEMRQWVDQVHSALGTLLRV